MGKIKGTNNVMPLNVLNQLVKSICKISIKDHSASGFFMKVSDTQKYLITNYHVINELNAKDNIEFMTAENKIFKLTLNDRGIKYFKNPKDITVIEIKETDQIYKEVQYLDYDINYMEEGYLIYEQQEIYIPFFSHEGPMGSKGIINCSKNNEFLHNCDTLPGGSGAPIISANSMKVIGVHSGVLKKHNVGVGQFIGEIIKEIEFPNFENISNLDKNKIFTNNNNSNSNNNIIINNNNNPHNLNIPNIKVNSIGDNHIYNSINNHNLINNIDNNTNKSIEYSNKNNISVEKMKETLLVLTNEEKDVITLHFQSSDQSLNYAVRCKISEKFNVILNKIVDSEPKLVEIGFYCLSNGAKVNEYKTIKDNNFKDGDKIIIQLVD